MWPEILPGLGLMWAALAVPGISIMAIQKYMNNGKEQRSTRSPWLTYLLDRDMRVGGLGESYQPKGLENIN